MSRFRSSRLSVCLVALLLAACAGENTEDQTKPIFHKGEEFRLAADYRDRALDHHEQAQLAGTSVERQQWLESADRALGMAQLQYEDAMKVYSHHQREEIEFEMAAVHELRKKIERER